MLFWNQVKDLSSIQLNSLSLLAQILQDIDRGGAALGGWIHFASKQSMHKIRSIFQVFRKKNRQLQK